MKRFFVFIFLFILSINVYSQNSDNDYYYFSRIEGDINMSLLFLISPPNENYFGFMDFNVGIAFGIFPKYLYFGVSCDIALGLDWVAILLGEYSWSSGSPQIGFNLGGRIYSMFQMNNLKLWSFAGFDYLFVVLPKLYAGAEISYKMIGLEYAYYFPITYESPMKHRISIKFHMPKSY